MRKFIKLIIYFIPYPFFMIFEKMGLIKNLKICKVTSQRIGHLPADIFGYLINYTINDDLRKIKVIFFHDKIICNQEIVKKVSKHIRIFKNNFILNFIINFLNFWNKKSFIFDISPYNVMHLNQKIFYQSKNYLSFDDSEQKKINIFFKNIKMNHPFKWICFHNRDGEYLKKKMKSGWPLQFGNWSYHNHRDFSFESMVEAALYFSKNDFNVLRMGSLTSEVYNKSSNKVFDYINSEYQNDLNDIYLLSKCQFYFGSDSGVNILPILAKKPIYIINMSPTQIYMRTSGLAFKTSFIFKRPKSKSTSSLLTLSEFMNTDCFFSTSFYDLDRSGIDLKKNSSSEILNFAKECLRNYQGEKYSKEDEEIQDEFDNLYRKLFNKFKLSKKIKLGENKIRISPSFLKLNQDLLK